MGRIPSPQVPGKAARRALPAFAVCVALLALPSTALGVAANYTVNTVADNAAAAGECQGVADDCSIRQALDIAVDGDTVSIPAGHYTLDAGKGPLVVTTDIAIVGTGTPVLDGDGQVRVLSIGTGQIFPTVTVDGITVTGGFDGNGDGGGGIAVWGTLNLNGSTVTGNTSTRFGTGGGIALLFNEAHQPVARIVGSTISGNTANSTEDFFNPQGGGIYVTFAGTLTVINSTISGNTAGPGTSSGGQGGGIWTSQNGTTALFNTTVIGNTASGTGAEGGNLFQFANDDGVAAQLEPGVVVPPYLIQNTIVADGNAPNGPNCGGGNPVSQGNNLVSDGQCGSVGGLGDLSGAPGVSGLQNNGGPTFTRKLLPGSAAINTGNSGGCKDDTGAAITVDQRGVSRPQGGRCDIGAVEFAPPLAVTGQPNSVTGASATITGDVTNPFILPGTAHFEFGTSTAYGQTFPLGSVAAGASHDPRSTGVVGLSPGVVYHYRIVVVNDEDTSFGEDVTFTTPVDGTPPPPPGTTPQQQQPAQEPEVEVDNPSPHKPTVRAARVRRGCVRRRFSARISVHVMSTARVRRIVVTVDGHRVKRTRRRRFSVRVNARRLSTGSHLLRVTATDTNGRRTSLRRVFRRCVRVQPAFTG